MLAVSEAWGFKLAVQDFIVSLRKEADLRLFAVLLLSVGAPRAASVRASFLLSLTLSPDITSKSS